MVATEITFEGVSSKPPTYKFVFTTLKRDRMMLFIWKIRNVNDDNVLESVIESR
jgi:hypothetical protein